jgi:type I restriction enzyme S subunit
MNDLGIRVKRIKATEDRPIESVSGSYTYFADGDVLLAKITPCFENGKLGIASGLTNGIGFGSSEFIVFRPKDSLDAEYLFYFLSQDSFRDAGASVMSGAVGHKRVPKEFIENLPIPLPPLPEQKRIVAILDEAFAGIDTAVANTEKNLANARELFESYLNSVFSQRGEGWVNATLEQICVIARGGSPRPIKAFLTNESDGVNWIKIGDATASSKFIYETKQKIRPEGVKRSRMVHSGDLLLSNSMSFGRPYIMKTSGCIHDGWLVLSNKSGMYETNYLYYFLGSSEAYRQFDLRAAGSTVRNLNIDLVRSVQVPIPPLPEQARIVENIEELGVEAQRLKSSYQQKLTALAELKQSLLQKAFSGELTADRAAPNASLKDEAVA